MQRNKHTTKGATHNMVMTKNLTTNKFLCDRVFFLIKTLLLKSLKKNSFPLF